jgi:hypothetical protein
MLLRVAVNRTSEPQRVVSVVFDPQDEGQTMRLHVDKHADALYLCLEDSRIIESEEVARRDSRLQRKNGLVGVEMLYLPKRTPNLKTTALEFESV